MKNQMVLKYDTKGRANIMNSDEIHIEDWLTAIGLKTFRNNLETYNRLMNKKASIIRALSGIKSVDFSKDKVSGGASHKTSPQEILAIRLEDINKQLQILEVLLDIIKPAICKQISRLSDFDSRKVLQLFYLEGISSSNCTRYFYGDNEDLKENWDIYLQKFKTLKRQALKDFDKLATVKYVIVEQKTLL